MLGLVYTAYIIMDNAVRSYKASEKALVVLGWVGFIDMVLVHYSVLWWQSLHQQSTLFNLGQHTMPWSMLGPLLLSMLCVAMAIVVYVSHSLSREMDWV
jgi:heme exporter protein C